LYPVVSRGWGVDFCQTVLCPAKHARRLTRLGIASARENTLGPALCTTQARPEDFPGDFDLAAALKLNSSISSQIRRVYVWGSACFRLSPNQVYCMSVLRHICRRTCSHLRGTPGGVGNSRSTPRTHHMMCADPHTYTRAHALEHTCPCTKQDSGAFSDLTPNRLSSKGKETGKFRMRVMLFVCVHPGSERTQALNVGMSCVVGRKRTI
jgi:hypothetical protein